MPTDDEAVRALTDHERERQSGWEDAYHAWRAWKEGVPAEDGGDVTAPSYDTLCDAWRFANAYNRTKKRGSPKMSAPSISELFEARSPRTIRVVDVGNDNWYSQQASGRYEQLQSIRTTLAAVLDDVGAGEEGSGRKVSDACVRLEPRCTIEGVKNGHHFIDWNRKAAFRLDGKTAETEHMVTVACRGTLWQITPAGDIAQIEYSSNYFTPNYLADDPTDLAAEPPLTNGWIRQVVGKEQERAVWEFLAYTLLPGNNMKTLLFLYGESDSGKTMFLDLLKEIHGKEFVEPVVGRKLINGNFAVEKLYNTQVATFDEECGQGYDWEGVINRYTGGDDADYEGKNKRGGQFIPNFKIIMIDNDEPRIMSNAEAYAKRFLVIHCEQVFKKSERAKRRIIKVWQSELQQIIGKLLRIAGEITKAGGIERTAKSDELMQRFIRDSNKVHAFLESRAVITGDTEDEVLKDDLIGAFNEWHRQHYAGKRVPGDQEFGRLLKAHKAFKAKMITESRRATDVETEDGATESKKKLFIKGIKLTNEHKPTRIFP